MSLLPTDPVERRRAFWSTLAWRALGVALIILSGFVMVALGMLLMECRE